jgi:hypothetical protein
MVAPGEASGKLDKIGLDPAGIGGIMDALVEARTCQKKRSSASRRAGK